MKDILELINAQISKLKEEGQYGLSSNGNNSIPTYTLDTDAIFTDENNVYIFPIRIKDTLENNSIEIVETIYGYDNITELIDNSSNYMYIVTMDNKYYEASKLMGKDTKAYVLDKEGNYEILTLEEVNTRAEAELGKFVYLIVAYGAVKEILWQKTNVLDLAKKIKEAYGSTVQIYEGLRDNMDIYSKEAVEYLVYYEMIKLIEEI